MSEPMDIAQSPTVKKHRQASEETQHKFQALNQRLEFYILQQRGKDAATVGLQRALEDLRAQHQRELEARENEYAEERKRAELQRDQYNADFVNLQAELNRAKAAAASAKRDSEREADLRQAGEDRLLEAIAKIETQRSHIELHQNDKLAVEEKLEPAHHAAKEHFAAKGLSDAKAEDVREQNKHLHKTVGELETEIEELRSRGAPQRPYVENKELSDRFLRDQQKKLAEMLAREQLKHEEKLAAIQKDCNARCNGYIKKLEDCGHKLAQARENVKALEADNKELADERDEAESQNALMADKIKKLLEDIELLKSRKGADLAAAKADILRLKRLYAQKDDRFNELMDPKIAFDSELNILADMMAAEEKRVGLTPLTEAEEQAIRDELAKPEPKKKRAAPEPEEEQPKKKTRRVTRSSKKAKAKSKAKKKSPKPSPKRSPRRILTPELIDGTPGVEDVVEPTPEPVSVAEPEPEPEPVAAEPEAMELDAKSEEEPMEPRVAVTPSENAKPLASGSDEYGSYVTIHNTSEQGLPSLSGWKMKFATTEHIFEFPNTPFNHKDDFTIRMGASVPAGFGENGRGGIVPIGTWEQNDVAFLVNPDDIPVAEFAIVPGTDMDEGEEDTEQDGDSGCSMM